MCNKAQGFYGHEHSLCPEIVPDKESQQVIFLSDQECADDMLAAMDDDSRASWSNISKEDLIAGHFSTGRNIRNHYKMWWDDNHFSNAEVEEMHPDARSMRVMRLVWEAVNGEQDE